MNDAVFRIRTLEAHDEAARIASRIEAAAPLTGGERALGQALAQDLLGLAARPLPAGPQRPAWWTQDDQRGLDDARRNVAKRIQPGTPVLLESPPRLLPLDPELPAPCHGAFTVEEACRRLAESHGFYELARATHRQVCSSPAASDVRALSAGAVKAALELVQKDLERLRVSVGIRRVELGLPLSAATAEAGR